MHLGERRPINGYAWQLLQAQKVLRRGWQGPGGGAEPIFCIFSVESYGPGAGSDFHMVMRPA